jgi:hypothetical protein
MARLLAELTKRPDWKSSGALARSLLLGRWLMNRVAQLGFLAWLLIGMAAEEAYARKWTDRTGGHAIEGELVELVDGRVTLKRDDGKLIHIALEKLSDADQDYVHQHAQKSEPENPFVEADSKPGASQGAKAAPEDQPRNTHTVIAEGSGTTPDEALKDALREAVHQVVGTLVDAETLVKNDHVIEKLLVYSGGFVTKYERLSEKQQNGLVRVKIQASVQRQALAAKLRAENITVKSLDGEGMFSELVTKADAADNALAMQEKILDGYPASVVRATVLDRPRQDAHGEGKTAMSYDVKLDVDLEKYEAVATKLVALLEKSAAKQGELSVATHPESDTRAEYLRKQMEKKLSGEWLDDERPLAFRRSRSKEVPFQFGEVFSLRPMRAMVAGSGFGYEWWSDQTDPKKTLVIAVNTARNQANDRTTWKWFHVDRPAKLRYGIQVAVSFLDSDHKEILHDRVSLSRESPGGSLPWRTDQAGPGMEREGCNRRCALPHAAQLAYSEA